MNRAKMLSVDVGILVALCVSLYQPLSGSRYESDGCQALDPICVSDQNQFLI